MQKHISITIFSFILNAVYISGGVLPSQDGNIVPESIDGKEFIHKHESGPMFNMYPDWMKDLSNSLTLGQITMPATHDTMARYGGAAVATQTLTLWQQFQYGVRALDIRCRHIENICAIHHGAFFQNAFLGDVLDDSVKFLTENPTEVILMRLKEEYNPSNNNRTLQTTISWYLNLPQYSNFIWRGGDRITTLGDARGKIIILDQIGYGEFGPNWVRCGSCTSPCWSQCIQDMYVVNSILPGDINKKWEHVHGHLSRSNSGVPDHFYINFLSGASLGAYPNAVADRINIRFVEYLRTNTLNYRNLGVVMMDFPLAEQITQIIEVNFHDVNLHVKVFEHQYEEGESKIFSIPRNTCITFGHWNNRASSVDTMGGCVRLYDRENCATSGDSIEIRSGDSCAYSLARCGWNDRASSIGHC